MTPNEISAFIAEYRAEAGCTPGEEGCVECTYTTLCRRGLGVSHSGSVVPLDQLGAANAADEEVTAGFGVY